MLKIHYRDVFKNQDKHWWYKGMREINLSLLNKYLTKKKNVKILDAGCGPGAMLPYLKKYGEVIGVDMSGEALKYAKKRGKVIKGDIAKLKFKDNSFDVVICMDVLYHTWVKDTSEALSEFKRVLDKDGLLLIREPAYNWMRGNEDRGSLTARRFSKNTLSVGLKQNGFKVKKISYVNFFLFPIVLIVRVFGMITKRQGSSDMNIPSKPVNNLLFGILNWEANLLKYISFLMGSSLVCVAVKK